MRADLFLTVIALSACQSSGLDVVSTNTSADFRIAPLTVTDVGCSPGEAAEVNAYELLWDKNADRLTLDLYAANGSGCSALTGGALIDTIANTVFMFYDTAQCVSTCPSGQSHLRLEAHDDLHGLFNSANLVVTLGQHHPDLSNLIIAGTTFTTRSDYAQYIPNIIDATIGPATDGQALMGVRTHDTACVGSRWSLQRRDSDDFLITPYAVKTAESCPLSNDLQMWVGTTFIPQVNQARVRVLSKSSDGTFAFVDAKR